MPTDAGRGDVVTDKKKHGDLADGNEALEDDDADNQEERAFIGRMLRGLGENADKQALLETVFALRLLQAFRGAGALLLEDVANVIEGAPLLRDITAADWTVAPFGFIDTRTGQRYDFRVQLLVTAHAISEAEAEERTDPLLQGKHDGKA